MQSKRHSRTCSEASDRSKVTRVAALALPDVSSKSPTSPFEVTGTKVQPPGGFGRRAFLKASGLVLVSASMAWSAKRATRKPMNDVIVLLPGIMGSVLQKDKRDVWGASPSGLSNAIRSLGASVAALELRDDSPNVDDLNDGITADRLFPDLHLIPGLWKIDGYDRVSQRIAQEFDVELGRNFFPFAYDWRRDNRVAARRLKRQSEVWLKARRDSGHQDAKLILIAHSMGGLVSRYFLECLEGWRDTRMLITFGTPYRGSLNALNFISNGYRKLGVEMAGLTELLRSFTSVYQLLPRYPCYDAGDGKLVRVGETKNIPGVDAQRAAAALEFHLEIERAVEAHLKEDAYSSNGYAIHPIVGTYQDTLQSAKLDGDRVAMLTTYGEQDVDGDGTVPRPSATPLEIDGRGAEMFVAEVHGSLQNADPVLVQLVGLLSSGRLTGFREPPPAVSVSVDDAYSSSEPISIRSTCQDESVALTAVITSAQNGREVARRRMRRTADGDQELHVSPLSEGAYRVTVGASGKVLPVTDVFMVFTDRKQPRVKHG